MICMHLSEDAFILIEQFPFIFFLILEPKTMPVSKHFHEFLDRSQTLGMGLMRAAFG